MKPQLQPAPWLARAREIAARALSPVGAPFAMKRDGKVAKLYLYDLIGYDPWFDEGIAAADIAAAVEEAKGADTLEVHINSPGGYVFEGIAIFNAIRSFKGEKVVHVDGIAASIASVIALAGDRVVTNEGAMWMIHRVSGGIFAMGTADEIETEAARVVTAIRALDENALDIYVNATGQSREQLKAWLSTDTYMTAQEALERGFTDEIVKQAAAQPENRSSKPAAAARVRTAAELVAQARAERADLHARFPAASRGPQHPGQPGAATHPSPARRQENRR